MAKTKNPNLSEFAFKNIMGITGEELPEEQQDSNQEIITVSNEANRPIIVSKEKVETRSKRVNLIVKPSVYAAAQK